MAFVVLIFQEFWTNNSGKNQNLFSVSVKLTLFTIHTKRLVVEQIKNKKKTTYNATTFILISNIIYCSSGGKHWITDVVGSLLFQQSKHRIVVFRFTDFHVCSVLFVFSLFVTHPSMYISSCSSLLRLNGDDLLTQVYFSLVLLVHSSLNIVFFLQCTSLYLLPKNDDQHCRSGSEYSTGTYNHHSCSFFCVNVCVLHFLDFFFFLYFLYIGFSKTHKAPALLALFSPTSVFHCFHPRTFFVSWRNFSLYCYCCSRTSLS